MPGELEEKSKKDSTHFIAAIEAAIAKTTFTYPFEKISKKLQDNRKTINKFAEYKPIIFGDAIHGSPLEKAKIFYQGAIPWGFTYKAAQLTTLGMLKPLQDKMRESFQDHPVLSDLASSGILTLAQTPLLQFLSNMKTLHQAGYPPQFKLFMDKNRIPGKAPVIQWIGNQNLFADLNAFRKEYIFKNAGITYARNFSFVAPLALVRSQMQNYFSHSGEKKLTPTQDIASSAAGSAAGLIFSSPFEVIKTRKQLLPAGVFISSFQIVKTMLEKEGISALTKGLGPNSATEFLGLLLFFSLQNFFSNKNIEPSENKSGFFSSNHKIKDKTLDEHFLGESRNNPFSSP